MELIVLVATIIATIIGLISGLIAISDKSKDFFFRKNRTKYIFETEFNDWKDSGFSYVSPRDTYLKIVNFIKINKFDDEREAFCLTLCTHYGDKLLHDLIKRNMRNEKACRVLLNMLENKGVRVGWRAEYALSLMDERLLDQCIASLPSEYLNRVNIQKSINNIKSRQIFQYLEDAAKGDDHRLRIYAAEVLNQLRE